MNPTLLNLHRKRLEWAYKAKEDFLHHLDGELIDTIEDLLHLLQTELENPNELSFSRLQKFFQKAGEEMELELNNYEKQLEPYELLITKQSFLIDRKKEESQLEEEGFTNEIDDYNRFLKQIELKSTDPVDISLLVDDTIEYTPHDRKASLINDDTARLQTSVERDLGTSLLILKQEASYFKIELTQPLELPFVPPIPPIEQKIDAFWFKGTYEKALSSMRSQAHDWVTEMYQNYNRLLTSILQEVTARKEQVIKEAEASKRGYRQKINTLENELTTIQTEEARLKTRYLNACELRKQFHEHAADLQGYLIKHWLAFKEELQQQFLYGDAESRFLAAHYLQLLRQDGERIIESLNRGGDV
ncbi:hypothetical protein [Bacillus sp. USDA818B3_A]|uniref:hypothetical protein n=1 Tax=Bacillus sp. USDA818B3_A TaxID=2698834 RepID=UPI0013682210|nr:hypothetical protein [Bacillus sp. USDA818B3_A]